MERREIFIPLAAICGHGRSVVAHFVEATKEVEGLVLFPASK